MVSAKVKNDVVSPRGFAQAFEVELVFVFEHRFETGARDVAFGVAVDRVADGHVVGRHRLGDGAGGGPGAEEPAHDFLAGPDFGEGAVAAVVEVDAQRLAVRVGAVGAGLDFGLEFRALHEWSILERCRETGTVS